MLASAVCRGVRAPQAFPHTGWVPDAIESLRRGAAFLLQDAAAEGNVPASELEAEAKPDAIGLVWELRAHTQLVAAIRCTELGIEFGNLALRSDLLCQRLLELQSDDGGWSAFGKGRTSTYATSMVISAFIGFHRMLSGVREPPMRSAVIQAWQWLEQNQLPDGGMPFYCGDQVASVSRTGVAAMAMANIAKLDNSDPADARDRLRILADWLLGHRRRNGTWSEFEDRSGRQDLEVTAYALLGLMLADVAPFRNEAMTAIDRVLDSRWVSEGISGWGRYLFPHMELSPRIWTTWCAVLVLLVYIDNEFSFSAEG